MDSGTGCIPGLDAPSSPTVVARGVSASPREYVSLARPADFRRVLSHGHRRKVQGVTATRLSSESPLPRVGLVVSRAVGSAVDRNRAKRRLRHALDTLELETGMDYVIIADRRVVAAPFSELCQWLGESLDS